MKTTYEEYTISKSEISILKELVLGKHALPEIQKSLPIKPSLLSYDLKKLLRKGIVKTRETGRRKYVYFSDLKHASLCRDLFLIYDYVDWQNILTGKAIEILFQILTNPGKAIDGFSKATVWRHLKNLKAHGILTLDKEGYSISPRFSILADFLNEYQRFFVNTLAKSISENALILWQKDQEFLVRVPKNVNVAQKSFSKTATSLFYDLGIPIFSEFDIYFYSKKKKKIRIEETIIHTLLIEANSVRYVIYSLLLLKKYEKRIDKEKLLEEARGFELNHQVSGMLQFLETHERQREMTLPTWEEFAEKAREYRVIE
jgi:DNA-binding transcriptional ArsR family regulator